MREEAVLLYAQPDGSCRAKIPVLRGLVIESPDRELAQHLARCAISRTRPGSEPVFIDVSPEAAVEPNPWLDTAGIFADDPTWDEFISEMKAARARNNARTFDHDQGVQVMQFTVILRPQPDGSIQALVPAIAGIAASGASREEAIRAAQSAVREAFADAEIASIEVPLDGEAIRNPLLEMAGIFAGDPTLEPMLREIYAARDAERP